jgi:hypothetical protein
MFTPKCPICLSRKIKHGYLPTPIFRQLLFRYNLRCSKCNWEFIGFAFPGMIPAKKRKRRQTSTNLVKLR